MEGNHDGAAAPVLRLRRRLWPLAWRSGWRRSLRRQPRLREGGRGCSRSGSSDFAFVHLQRSCSSPPFSGACTVTQILSAPAY
jgi:hypothetical protein